MAQRQCRRAQSETFAMRMLRDLGGLVIAEVGSERRDQHQRACHQLGDARAIRLDTARAVAFKAACAVAEQPHALQEVVDQHRLVDIEFEIARGASEIDGHIVAEHLTADHGQRFALRRVDLAGHDRTAGLVLRND